jgi:hypothetical protein
VIHDEILMSNPGFINTVDALVEFITNQAQYFITIFPLHTLTYTCHFPQDGEETHEMKQMTTLHGSHIYSQQQIDARNLPSVFINPGIYPELLGFSTLYIVRNSKYETTQRSGICICFRPQVRRGR